MNNSSWNRWFRLPTTTHSASAAVAGMAALLMLSGCSTTEVEPIAVTPITADNTGEYHPGRFVWHDLLTNDVDAAKRFYGGVFGWSFAEQGPYTVISNNGVAIAGMAKPKFDPGLSSFWLPYLSVADVDSSLATAKSAGAELLKGPGHLENRGRYALIGDSQGARLVLLRSESGDPKSAKPEINGWLWNELWSADTVDSLRFYQQLAGYQTLPPPPGQPSDDYEVLIADDTWAAGLTSLPFAEMNSQWVPAIRVADLDEAVARVKEFGGRVVIEPDHDLSTHRVAMVQDPTGAILMIGPWQDDQQQEAK